MKLIKVKKGAPGKLIDTGSDGAGPTVISDWKARRDLDDLQIVLDPVRLNNLRINQGFILKDIRSEIISLVDEGYTIVRANGSGPRWLFATSEVQVVC